MRKPFLGLITLAISAMASCAYVNTAAADEITVGGTGDSEKVLGLIAEAFMKKNPAHKVNVPGSIGSGGGIKAVSDGKIQLARIARPIQDNEKKYELKTIHFADSPVVFAANMDSSINKGVSGKEVVNLYSGKITNWKDLGGADQKLYLIVREKGDSSTAVLLDGVPGFKEIANPAGKVAYSTPEATELITQHKGTLGYFPLGMVAKAKVKILDYEGVAPSEKNVASGGYKLVVPFLLAYKGELTGVSKSFVDFLKSPAAQKILSDNGVFPRSD